MFTGLVEELGKVRQIRQGEQSARLTIEAPSILEDVKLGDSIAVNGVCLTVTAFGPREFTVDVMPETMRLSNIGKVKLGDPVNLERALRMGDRLGGHLVSGHIDGTGIIRGQENLDIAVVIEIEAPPQVMKYVVPKGSIAIDGISLTVVDHTTDSFRVSLIPHTGAVTTLGVKSSGALVNLEGDMIGKYVERFVLVSNQPDRARQKTRLTADFLSENGFI